MFNEEELKRDVYSLLDNSKYAEAKEKISSAVNAINKEYKSYGTSIAMIAGLLIDLGSEGYDKDSAESGIKILKENEAFFKSFLSEQSFAYNMGNGMHALYKI